MKKIHTKTQPCGTFCTGFILVYHTILDFKYFDRLSTSLEFWIKNLCYKAVPKISNYTSYANLVSFKEKCTSKAGEIHKPLPPLRSRSIRKISSSNWL